MKKRYITGIFPIISFAMDKGIEPNTILLGTHLSEKCLLDSNKTIDLEQELTMIRNLSAQYPNPELSWELGRYYHARAHGVIGSLIVNAPTLGDAYTCILEYLMLSHSFFSIYTETVSGRVRVYPIDNNLPPDLLPFLVERDFVAGLTVLEDLFPDKKTEIQNPGSP
ncbi:MAG: AraC family transcriptional regulator ligand-binding domain-containing protein [Bacteroidota bacterium]